MDNLPSFLIVSLVLLFLSGFFSATETAFSSLSVIKIKGMISSEDKKAKRAEKTLTIYENFDRLLTTLLIGNNIVNILLSTISTIYFTSAILNQSYAAALSTAVVTIAVLIFGEITPKNLAKEAPEGFAMSVTPIISVLMTIFTPFNLLFNLWKKLILKIFKVKKTSAVTEGDIITIVSEAESGGEIDEEEGKIIKSAVTFGDLDVYSVMTPRVNLIAVEKNDSKEEIYETFSKSGFTRIPVYEDTVDNIIGIINLKDYYEKVMLGNETTDKVISNVTFISQHAKIDDVLKVLQSEKCHLAVAVDDYGGTAGIITVEDIIEELVGEIYDERDKIEKAVCENSDGSYTIKGSSEICSLPEELHIPESDDYTTLAGFIILHAEKIPEQGECFSIGDLNIKIASVLENRIEDVEITINQK